MIFHLRENKRPVDNTRCTIYCIKDPVSKKIMYIGRTTNFYARRSTHISASSWEKNKKAKWIKALLKKGLIPIFEIIQTTDTRSESILAEKFFIDSYLPPLNTKI